MAERKGGEGREGLTLHDDHEGALVVLDDLERFPDLVGVGRGEDVARAARKSRREGGKQGSGSEFRREARKGADAHGGCQETLSDHGLVVGEREREAGSEPDRAGRRRTE